MSGFVHQRTHTADDPEGSLTVLVEPEMVVSFYNHQPEISLEFYNADYDSLTLSGELQMAQKWVGIVKGFIKGARQHMQVKQGSRLEEDAPGPVIPNPQYDSSGEAIRKKANRRLEKESAI